MRLRYSTILFIYLLTICFPAHACQFQKPLTRLEMNKADVVFIGRASTIGVAVCSGGCKGKEPGNHTIIFDIEKIIKGKDLGKSVEVYWQNGMFGEVDDVLALQKRYGLRNKVGIILPETIKAHLRCRPLRGVIGNGKPVSKTSCTLGLPLPFAPDNNSKFDKPWIISDVCSEAYIQKQID